MIAKYIGTMMLCGLMCGSAIAAPETLTNVLSPLQSSNSVIRNDCNLGITNSKLMEKIHGNDTDKTFRTANDIITAYNATIYHISCGGKAPVIGFQGTTSFIENLCTLGIAKLEGTAEKLSRPSYPLAKKMHQWLNSSGTSTDGIIPGLIKQQLSGQYLGSVPVLLSAYSSPEKCGVIPITDLPSLTTVYNTLADSIYKIATDCSEDIPWSTNWIKVRLTMLSSSSQTPYVFGVKQGSTDITNEIARCQQRITESYARLISKAQTISIKGGGDYNKKIIEATASYYQDEGEKLTQIESQGLSLFKMATQDTPITTQCNVQS